jgi:hypothetical protein
MRFGVFKFKKISVFKIFPVSICFGLSAFLANQSLSQNSMGTYQCIKGFSTPLIIIFVILFTEKEYSIRILLSVVSINDNFLLIT